jgi:hypothetical protein
MPIKLFSGPIDIEFYYDIQLALGYKPSIDRLKEEITKKLGEDRVRRELEFIVRDRKTFLLVNSKLRKLYEDREPKIDPPACPVLKCCV